MKQWTVMLIPQGRGATQTFTIASWHFWAPASLLILLSFFTAFFAERNAATQNYLRSVQEAKRALELASAQKQAEAPAPAVQKPGEDTKALEARLRAEYEASLAKITAELNQLYDMEAKARDITGLAPRRAAASSEGPLAGKGQGGPSISLGGIDVNRVVAANRPAFIIYGLSRPSADLILQEITLRRESFSELVTDLQAEQDRVQRIPGLWPLAHGAGQFSSRYGMRVDPFNHRIRHHDGDDISAKAGTGVRATARGVVQFAGWDNEYGNCVRIDHGNGLETWYGHLSRIDVKAGAKIERGQGIGAVGSTGRSTGPHLHYEVHSSGRTVNPAKYLGG